MMHSLLTLAFLVIAAGAQDQPKEPRPEPGKGDTIVVEGCIRGSKIEDVNRVLTFRLTGPKDLLKQLKKEHDGHMDEVTAVLQSSLSVVTPGTQVGKTRITISGGRDPMGPQNAPQGQYLPTLKVTSFRHLPGTCPAR